MRMSQAKQAAILLAYLSLGGLIAQPAVATHEQVEYDFDDGFLVGWSSTLLSPGSPFGGNYLGDFSASTQVSLGILDALPAGNPPNSDPRLVALDFDIVNYFPPTEDYRITVNGIELDLESSGSISGMGPNVSASLSFPLVPDAFGSADMVIGFEKSTGFLDWGVDNVIVDWSQPLPEPSSFVLMWLGLLLTVPRTGHNSGPN